MDWTATILAVTGTTADPAYPLDGEDLMPVCTGKQALYDRTLFWRTRAMRRASAAGVSPGRWSRTRSISWWQILAHEEPHRLRPDVVGLVLVVPFRKELANSVEQDFDALARLRGYHETIGRSRRDDLWRNQVSLGVDHEHWRHGRALERRHLEERRRRRQRCGMEMENEIGAGERGVRRGEHPGLHQVGRIEELRKIVKYDLDTVVGAESHHREPRRLRLGADDRESLAEQRIEERRLAGIRCAGQRDMTKSGWRRARHGVKCSRPRRGFLKHEARAPGWSAGFL